MHPVQQVSDYDKKLLDEYRDYKRRIANQILVLNTMTESQGLMQESYEDKKAALELLQEAKQQQILLSQQKIDERSEDLSQLEALEKEMASKVDQIEKNAWSTVTYSVPAYNGDFFVWPQPSSTKINSDYGWRGNIGVPGASYDHKGIDIDAKMFDPVVAAAPGVVIDTSYHGTGGKTVIIDIGSNITLIYHHLNDYAVEVGQQVAAGQVVGYVGMTGVTSGPHLHFGVRVNGVYVDPKPFLGLPGYESKKPEEETTTQDGDQTGENTGETGSGEETETTE